MSELEIERAPAIEDATPGTVHLVDLTGTMKAKHAGNEKDRDIILLPAPSQDPEDPLNWSPRRKRLHLACISM
jgi:hypothetical protein